MRNAAVDRIRYVPDGATVAERDLFEWIEWCTLDQSKLKVIAFGNFV